MTIDWFLRQAWRWSAGLPEERPPARLPDLPVLQQTEWSPDFEHLMRNRLIMGAFRYGLFNDPKKGHYDHTGAIAKHLLQYIDDGNLEHLVDIANLSLVEFCRSRHPKRHFNAQDDSTHARKVSE